MKKTLNKRLAYDVTRERNIRPKGGIAVKKLILLCLSVLFMANQGWAEDTVKIGMNFPKSGPYKNVGIDQWRATKLAVEEINKLGGILGKKVEVVWRDSMSKVPVTKKNIIELIEIEKVAMIFGGVSSGVAIMGSKLCQEKGVLFMPSLTASNATTGKEGHRHTFRVCYNAWMGAKVLGKYLKDKFPGKKYFYVTADYTWGWSTEESLRKFTETEDRKAHGSTLTKFPGATELDIRKALNKAVSSKADILVCILFGKDMETAMQLATDMKIKKKMQIVVPLLELSQAENAGAEAMEGIIGTADWNWKVPYQYGYSKGKEFVDKFAKINKRYPCWGASTTYTILYEYKSAVERAQSFEAAKVIKALEGHKFTLLKDEQEWRDFDHQCIQSVYLVQCESAKIVNKDKYKLDYFKILEQYSGTDIVRTKKEWEADRKKADKPLTLEALK
jgi:branched-chain amino acid transport system substrate-binding protein